MPYTYHIVGNDVKKAASREMIGKMSVEILEIMRDELVSLGVKEWLEYENIP